MADSRTKTGGARREGYAGVERRSVPRYLFPRSLSCRARPVGGAEWWPGQGLDLSLKGLGLFLPQPLSVGQIAIVELKRPDRDVCLTRLLRVAHAFHQPNGMYRVGGQFLHDLTAAELEALLS
jgi:hypothetical protein